jgi:TrmH family RNA methyltransferase
MELSRREKNLLMALTTRGGRRRSGCCRCEGVRVVCELLQFFPDKVKFVAATERGRSECDFELPNLRIVSEKEYDEISGTVNGQGVIAVAEIPECASGAVQGDFILALDQLGDPGNFGTIARTLRAAGQKELWYTKGSIDPWGDKAVRSAMGAQFGLNLRRFDTLEELTVQACKAGFDNIFIADPHKGTSCFRQDGLFDHSVIVIGGEPNGVMGFAPNARSVIIPMPGGYESINAAQAATVLIFESVRRKMECDIDK